MRYFPIFVDLKDRAVLIVGGGEAALQKARLVAKSGARILVVAPVIDVQSGKALHQLAAAGSIDLQARPFAAADLAAAALVYAASGDAVLDGQVASAAKRHGVPVNVIDDAGASNFITPAVVNRAPVVVAIGTEGAAPVLARAIKARIEALLPANLGETAQVAARFRQRLATLVPSPRARRQFWARVFGAFDQPATPLLTHARLEALAAKPDSAAGGVTIIGIGPGDPDLLVHKARRVLDGADVVFHPAGLSPAILDLARREARFVAYRANDDVTTGLAAAARAGGHVACLLPGEGHQPDCAQSLSAAGVATSVIPGIAVPQTLSSTQIAEIAA